MKIITALILLAAVSAPAQITNVLFSWDPSPDATGYRFYDGYGSNRVLLGTTSNLNFRVTNWNVSVPRTVSVTATNILGESTNTVLTVPPAPLPVQNLKPVPLSIVSPVPGLIELSSDLVDWSERIRLFTESNPAIVRVTWVQYPNEPMMFLRSRDVSVPLPPMPSARAPP